MIYRQLFQKYAKKDSVYGAIIGAGRYGTALVTQQCDTPYLKIPVVADINPEAAKQSLLKAGIAPQRIVYCADEVEAETAIRQGMYVFTDNPDLVPKLSCIDVVCESTGSPEAGARHALDALSRGKHVAMITKDCDVTVGPILKQIAERNRVVYTPVDGDQHGLLIQLVEWAKMIGLTILCAGKATDGELVLDSAERTVKLCTDKPISPPFRGEAELSADDLRYFAKIPQGKAREYVSRRVQALKKLPTVGGYDLCEMTIAANYTGLAPAADTLTCAPLRITELPVAYCEKSSGGIFENGGVIDLVNCLRCPDESGLGGGVFLVVRCDNAYSNHILTTKGQIANYDDSAAVIYRPYHLCGVESSISLLTAGLLDLDTAAPEYDPRYDLVKSAARDIRAGEKFGNDHSPQLTAHILPAKPIARGNYAAANLLTGNAAAVDIPRGTLITYDMVREPEDSVLWDLRRRQDREFL